MNTVNSKRTGIVYALLFDDGQVYIGATVQTLKVRLWCHKSYANIAKLRTAPVHRLWHTLGAPTPFILHRAPANQLQALEAQAIREYGATLNVLARAGRNAHRHRVVDY